MPSILSRTRPMLLAAAMLGSSATAFAGQEMLLLDAPQRAKVAKEKIRASAKQRESDEREKKDGAADDSASCGSQSIGNVDTGGRPGAGPREVFVFAPNAINVVGRGSCR